MLGNVVSTDFYFSLVFICFIESDCLSIVRLEASGVEGNRQRQGEGGG